MRWISRPLLLAATASTALLLAVPAAGAHTEPDLIAVPAGSTATLELKPTHGCGGSPTVQVSIRAPVSGATAVDVPGWISSTTPDSKGHTVLEWSGGSLPTDMTGEFPVTFTVPDRVGELLTFPSIQVCENGEELAWISGDPGSDTPAPRLLILPAGSQPAATLDEVPPDAPGRDQLAAIVDVDSPAPEDEPAVTTTSTSTTSPADDDFGEASGAPAPSTDDDGAPGWIVPAVGLAVVAALGGWFALRKQRG